MQRYFLRPKRIILLNLLPLSSSMFSFTQIVNNLELEQNLNNTQTFLGLRMPVKNSPFKLCSSFFAVTVKAVFHCFTLRRLFSIHLLVCGQEIEFLHNAAIITFSDTEIRGSMDFLLRNELIENVAALSAKQKVRIPY